MKKLLSIIMFEESVDIESIPDEHGLRTPPKCKTCCRVVHSECSDADSPKGFDLWVYFTMDTRFLVM